MSILSTYLEKTGDSLCFQSQREFESGVETLDTSVPSRTEGRKSFHRERACLVMFLKALVASSQIDFPFCVRKSESPDFVLTIRETREIGIEHRDITSQGYQKHLSESANKPADDPVWLDQFKSGGPPTSLVNAGWVGDEVEREWAQLALEAIRRKLELLNKTHFLDLDSYELLLYSNTYLPNVDRQKAIAFLSALLNKELAAQTVSRHFDSISIIYGNEVWLRQLTANDQ